MNKLKGVKDKLIEWGKYHLTDTTSMLGATNPIYAPLETLVFGMPCDESIATRALVAGLSYAGLGLAFSKGRDLSRYLFKITEETKEKIQHLHDAVYGGAFTAITSPILYYFTSAKDFKSLFYKSLAVTATAALTGGYVGLSIDAGRDLLGLEESERMPKIIKYRSPVTKKAIFAGLAVSSVGLMSLIYKNIPK